MSGILVTCHGKFYHLAAVSMENFARGAGEYSVVKVGRPNINAVVEKTKR
jgi:hypothetical protein